MPWIYFTSNIYIAIGNSLHKFIKYLSISLTLRCRGGLVENVQRFAFFEGNRSLPLPISSKHQLSVEDRFLVSCIDSDCKLYFIDGFVMDKMANTLESSSVIKTSYYLLSAIISIQRYNAQKVSMKTSSVSASLVNMVQHLLERECVPENEEAGRLEKIGFKITLDPSSLILVVFDKLGELTADRFLNTQSY